MGKENHQQLQLCFAHHPGAGQSLPRAVSYWNCSAVNSWLGSGLHPDIKRATLID